MRISDWSSDVCSSDLLPTASTEDMRELLHANLHVDPERSEFPRPAPRMEDAETLARRIAASEMLEPSSGLARERERLRAEPEPEENRAAMIEILNDMAREEDCTFQSSTTLFQDFTIRCRMKGISVRGLDATMFRRG